MKSTTWFVTYPALLAAAAWLSPAIIGQVKEAPIANGHKAFTAKLLTTDAHIDSTEGPETKTLIAIRRDGSRVDIVESIDDTPAGNKVIIDVPAKRRIVIDVKTKSKTTYPMADSELAPYVSVPSMKIEADAVALSIAGRQGFPIDRMLEQGYWEEAWVCPELDYFKLRFIHTYENGVLTAEVKSLTVGEPNPALFEIPSDYIERSPIEVLQETARLRGEKYQVSPSDAALEGAYKKARTIGFNSR
jgi:hypothetical protein